MGAAASVVAALSLLLAWNGGLWATPVWLAFALGALRMARRAPNGRAAAFGLALAALATATGVYAFFSTGGFQPALRTDASAYSAGDVVEVRLRAGIRSVGYNLCFAFLSLQRRSDAAWENAPAASPGPNVACTSEMRVLPPFFGATGQAFLPRDLAPGLYRISHNAQVAGEDRPVASNIFSVE